MAKIEAEKELTLKEIELKAQDQASTSAAAAPLPSNRDAKTPEVASLYRRERQTRQLPVTF